MPLNDPSFRDLAAQGAIAGALGMIGRLMAIAADKDRPSTVRGLVQRLVWELPIACGLGIVGKGVAETLGMAGFAHYAVVIAVSYSGTQFVDLALRRVLTSDFFKKAAAPKKKD